MVSKLIKKEDVRVKSVKKEEPKMATLKSKVRKPQVFNLKNIKGAVYLLPGQTSKPIPVDALSLEVLNAEQRGDIEITIK